MLEHHREPPCINSASFFFLILLLKKSFLSFILIILNIKSKCSKPYNIIVTFVEFLVVRTQEEQQRWLRNDDDASQSPMVPPFPIVLRYLSMLNKEDPLASVKP